MGTGACPRENGLSGPRFLALTMHSGRRMAAFNSSLRSTAEPFGGALPAPGNADSKLEGLRVLLRVPQVDLDAAPGTESPDPTAATGDVPVNDPAAALAALACSLRTTTAQMDADAAELNAGAREAAAAGYAAKQATVGPQAGSSSQPTLQGVPSEAEQAPAGQPSATAIAAAKFNFWLQATIGRWFEPQSLISIAAVLCVCSIAVMLIGRRQHTPAGRARAPEAVANLPAEIAPPPVAMGEPSGGMPTPPADLMNVPSDMPTAPPSAMVNTPAANEPGSAAAMGPALGGDAAYAPASNALPESSVAGGYVPSAAPPLANTPASISQSNRPLQNPDWSNQEQVERLPPLYAAPNSPGAMPPLPTRNGPDGVLRNRFAEPGSNTRAAVAPNRSSEFVARRPEAVANQPAGVTPTGPQADVEMTAQPPAARITRITPLAEAEPGAAP